MGDHPAAKKAAADAKKAAEKAAEKAAKAKNAAEKEKAAEEEAKAAVEAAEKAKKAAAEKAKANKLHYRVMEILSMTGETRVIWTKVHAGVLKLCFGIAAFSAIGQQDDIDSGCSRCLNRRCWRRRHTRR